jgi:serine phosphatase RsbU (regulator of sigma subunit)
VFALVTDGIVETPDDQSVEFGLERLAGILCEMAEVPLSEVFEYALGAVRRHGLPRDDQTLMLVRAVG